jgi:D-alanyl-D-alanine dipeptidase
VSLTPIAAAAALLAASSATSTASTATPSPAGGPPVADADDPLVDAATLVPGLIVQLTYARPDNLAGRALLPQGATCRLRRSVALRLAGAARALATQGLRLVAWDCTRSLATQRALFGAFPHPGRVADPARGSLHQRGVAVDLGLADLAGRPVPLPTRHDEFCSRTPADAPLPDAAAGKNRDALRAAMTAAGFRVNPREWWHYARLWGWRWPIAGDP